MDLTAVLLRLAAGSPHVLLVPVPGHARVRRSAERELARRGWAEATSPADADVLLVAGRPGPGLAAVIDAVWTRIPAPRVRIEIDTEPDLARVLDSVIAALADPSRARSEARTVAATELTSLPPDTGTPRWAGADGAEYDHDSPSGHGSSGSEHAGHAAEQEPGHASAAESDGHTDHGSHEGHHHHGGMELPGGLSMADLAEDRDGLTLDVLHFPLGPVLPEWPAGLIVEVAMQGDVITRADARVLDRGHTMAAGPGDLQDAVVRDLDVVARLLGVAGWDGPAGTARHLRDRLEDGGPSGSLRGQAERWSRRVRRSRALRLMLCRIETADGSDVAGLLERRLDRIEAHLAGRAPIDDVTEVDVADLGRHLSGVELAGARLLIAALDPDVDSRAADAGPSGSRRAGVDR
ncbi:hypothetical protein EV383_2544 [Pseudonocardia sediminis]|uniref:Uncharacterized protein n=1 Tax=Pseudonocardia sediminis TaxID=1397368 RepID=A0A4Q7UUN5_PSEST|nr:hypothetical protein [Pseudonocardia sediminis]RZT85667.1 hypothetical protein EV383_2544 [Pseudonocardia sediminis]